MESATQVQISNDAVYILIHANALGKGMYPSILSPTMGK